MKTDQTEFWGIITFNNFAQNKLTPGFMKMKRMASLPVSYKPPPYKVQIDK